ncbi:Leucine-Rich Repeat Transmembrane Neuronal Protein 1 [Manis pentadactyla]|nr:Leucine-Rich Repeat Transmembrane Neuronal Protein 1 [Manis pentadactyla]
MVQGVTNSHKLVIGHDSQDYAVQTSKKILKRQLNQAAHIGEDSAVSLNVKNHVWDCGRSKTEVSQGQNGEKEVHGGVEVGVRDDGQGEEQVPQDGDQILWFRIAETPYEIKMEADINGTSFQIKRFTMEKTTRYIHKATTPFLERVTTLIQDTPTAVPQSKQTIDRGEPQVEKALYFPPAEGMLRMERENLQ